VEDQLATHGAVATTLLLSSPIRDLTATPLMIYGAPGNKENNPPPIKH